MVKLDGYFLGVFWVGGFGGSGVVFAEVENSCPVIFGGWGEIDDEFLWVAFDGLNAFFNGNCSAHG